MQIAIQSMFRMPIVDHATSSFILFTVIVREKIEVVEDISASPVEPLKKLTHEFRPRDEQNYSRRTTVSQDNRIRM